LPVAITKRLIKTSTDTEPIQRKQPYLEFYWTYTYYFLDYSYVATRLAGTVLSFIVPSSKLSYGTIVTSVDVTRQLEIKINVSYIRFEYMLVILLTTWVDDESATSRRPVGNRSATRSPQALFQKVYLYSIVHRTSDRILLWGFWHPNPYV